MQTGFSLDWTISCCVVDRMGCWYSVASRVILAHCQDVKKIPRPSGLVSWIDANHPEGLPTPPVLGASTMGHSTQRSLSVAVMPPEEWALLSAGDSVDSARQLPDSLSYQSDSSVRDVSSDSPSTVVIFPTQEVCLVDATSSLHPFFMHRLDVGPIRLTTNAHAFNYREWAVPGERLSDFWRTVAFRGDIRLLSCSRLCLH